MPQRYLNPVLRGTNSHLSSPAPAPVTNRRTIGCWLNLLFIPALIILALLLPPISIMDRFSDSGYSNVGKNGADFNRSDGALLSISSKGMEAASNTKIKFESITRDAFLAKKAGEELTRALVAFPANLDLKSAVYLITLKGDMPSDAFFSAPIPDDADPYNTLDFYAWDGTKWDFLPGKFYGDDTSEATLSALPRAIVIAQTRATPPVISAETASAADVPQSGANAIAEVNALGLNVKDDGTLKGEMAKVAPSQNYIIVPSISNVEAGTVRFDIVTNILVNDDKRHAHVQAISEFVTQNLLPGIDINYQGLKPETRDYFSQFIKELGNELHARGKSLTVNVPLPKQISEEDYDTGAYDWQALGAAADGLKMPSLTTANAYKSGGAMESLLKWAVERVNRYKLQFALDTLVQDRVGNQTTLRTYDDALKSLLGKIKVEGLKPDYVEPSHDLKLSVSIAQGFSGFKRDEATKAYVYTYKDQSGEHSVYFETAESLTFKMMLAGRYHLRGISFNGLLGGGTDPGIWDAIAKYQQSVPLTAPKYQLVWTVKDRGATPIQTSEPSDLTANSFTWHAAPVPDVYTISVAISSNGQQIPGDQVAIRVVDATETPTPTPRPATATPVPQQAPVEQPTPKAQQQPTPKPTSPPVNNPPAPGPSLPGFFGYGIQIDPGNNLSNAVNQTKAIGFGWIKAQVPYKYYVGGDCRSIDFGTMDRIVNTATGAGLRVLFSIVKAPTCARPAGDTDEGPPADPNTYAAFVGAVAARYAGKGMAYEIWNEENLYYEWGGLGNKISATRYMALLKAAYAAIKAADAGAIVVSGAPTPTGADDGNIAINDQKYLQQLYANGLKNYSDVIGAHPSGFNCPADADWRTVTNASASFRGPFDNRHPSWCFRGTIEGYRAIMLANGDGAKRIWATEFGWATVEGLGVGPAAGYGYAADNSQAQQAQWITDAYRIGKSSGYMGVMFLWQLNYNNPPGDEKSAFSITYANGSPRPSFGALQSMPK